MSEGTFRSFDPLKYHVNNVADLDEDVVKAHWNKDDAAIGRMTRNGDQDFHIFICINKDWHAFLLCIPLKENFPDPMGIFSDMPKDDPFAVPDVQLTWLFELKFENPEMKLYKIAKEFGLFRDLKKRVKKAFHIGYYKGVKPVALQFAALRAAPHRYNVLLNDCVEFAKEFCVAMLSYCKNHRELEPDVNSRIKQATASGLSIEQLSRRVRSSAMVGNTFLEGLEISSFLGGRYSILLVIAFFVYPIIVSAITAIVVIKFVDKQ